MDLLALLPPKRFVGAQRNERAFGLSLSWAGRLKGLLSRKLPAVSIVVCIPTWAYPETQGLPLLSEQDYSLVQVLDRNSAITESGGVSFLCSLSDEDDYILVSSCKPILTSLQKSFATTSYYAASKLSGFEEVDDEVVDARIIEVLKSAGCRMYFVSEGGEFPSEKGEEVRKKITKAFGFEEAEYQVVSEAVRSIIAASIDRSFKKGLLSRTKHQDGTLYFDVTDCE